MLSFFISIMFVIAVIALAGIALTSLGTKFLCSQFYQNSSHGKRTAQEYKDLEQMRERTALVDDYSNREREVLEMHTDYLLRKEGDAELFADKVMQLCELRSQLEGMGIHIDPFPSHPVPYLLSKSGPLYELDFFISKTSGIPDFRGKAISHEELAYLEQQGFTFDVMNKACNLHDLADALADVKGNHLHSEKHTN